MNRHVTLLLLLIVGGAIVNVAVAWGCVQLTNRPSEVVVETLSDLHKEWLRDCQWDYINYPLESSIARYRGVRVEQLFLQGPRGSGQIAAAMRAGFPMPSLAGWFTPNCSTPREWNVDDLPWDSDGFWAYDPEFPHSSISKVLPLIPIWPGFAINTVFYALVLWLLFAAPLALRRRRRIKRGLCPKCAYDLRGTPHEAAVCPECGAAVTARIPIR